LTKKPARNQHTLKGLWRYHDKPDLHWHGVLAVFAKKNNTDRDGDGATTTVREET
jgi:hypothetical protein